MSNNNDNKPDTFSNGLNDSFATSPPHSVLSANVAVPITSIPDKNHPSPSRKLKPKSIHISYTQRLELIGFMVTLLVFFLMLFALLASSSYAVRGVSFVELRLTDSEALANVTQGEATWLRFGLYGYCYGNGQLEFIDCKLQSGLTVEPFDPLSVMQRHFPQVVTNLTNPWTNPSHNTGITFTIYLTLAFTLSVAALTIFKNIFRLYDDKHYTRGFLLALAFPTIALCLSLAIHLYTDGLRWVSDVYPQFTGSFENGLWLIGMAIMADLVASVLFFRGCC
ncbi:5143_t:CDS:2 [Ambispora gerdemannii]|uniref:5143_t:CDS:1 n=1 Tax=Ambispora gerdemannii TaxID=144530 RepID=A0A9N9FAJ1_9GLOM|nr:5143_t:CDS:2 [Ambispora gerdemannii]